MGKAGRGTLAIVFLPGENEVKTRDLLDVKPEGGEREREANILIPSSPRLLSEGVTISVVVGDG